MSLAIDDVLRVFDACDQLIEAEAAPLISLVFPYKGVTTCQVFLVWKQGRMLRDYLRDPALHERFSLHTAYYSRIVDQAGVKRRLIYVPKPNDELRFLSSRLGVPA
jgi:hypothetical protein